MKKSGNQPTFTKLHHVGLVVKDIDKTMQYFESIGIGPFKVGEQRKVTIPFKGELHGQEAEWKTTISNADMGGVELELLEPTEGNQALKESLEANGEGLHHIGFLCTDLDAAEANGKKDGLKIWTRSRMEGINFLYFEPSENGNLAIELRNP